MKHSTRHSKKYLDKRYHHILKQLRISGLSAYEALTHLDQLLTITKGKLK